MAYNSRRFQVELMMFRLTAAMLGSILLLFFFSCTSDSAVKKTENSPETVSFPKYAKGFRVIQSGQTTEVFIYNPYNQDDILQRCYILTKPSLPRPSTVFPDLVVSEPEKIVALSATQWGLFLELEQQHKIVGISEARFVRNKVMKDLLAKGNVIEVAAETGYKTELLLMLQPDLIMFSPDAKGFPDQLMQLNLPLLAWPDYFENDPLGRAEWIRLAGLITGKTSLADSLFFDMEAKYLQLKNKVVLAQPQKPSIFSDKIFAGQWYVPSGESYIAKIFEDAGATYVFKEYAGKAGIPLDIETIISKAAKADYWRIAHASTDYTYGTLANENELYAGFQAFKNRKIVFCNTLKTAYFEESPLYPHKVLADFVAIFHPELLPNHDFVYHELLTQE